MGSQKRFNIKNRWCYYPDIINIKDPNLDKILVSERQCQNIFIYRVAYKLPNDEKPLCTSFDNLHEYIEKDGEDSYLTLIPLDRKYEQIFEKIKNNHYHSRGINSVKEIDIKICAY